MTPVWGLPWTEFRRTWNNGPWTRNPPKEHGSYYGESLRSLIAFCVDPEPSDQEINEKLTRRTVRWTVKHAVPQFYFMSEIISKVPKLRGRQFSLTIFADNDFKVLISTAVDAYLNGRIQRRTLRAVLALHAVTDLNEVLVLARAEGRALGELKRSQPGMFPPIYPIIKRKRVKLWEPLCPLQQLMP